MNSPASTPADLPAEAGAAAAAQGAVQGDAGGDAQAVAQLPIVQSPVVQRPVAPIAASPAVPAQARAPAAPSIEITMLDGDPPSPSSHPAMPDGVAQPAPTPAQLGEAGAGGVGGAGGASAAAPMGAAREHSATVLWAVAALVLAVVATITAMLLWQRLSTMQEQLARQNLDAGNQAVEAKTLSNQAHEQAADANTRVAVLEGRVAELTAQRAQIDSLLQAASRSADDSLVADLEASLRMGLEQSQLTGSASPVLAALQSAQRRVAASTLPAAVRLQRAFAADVARIKAAPSTDAGVVLSRLDELIRQVDLAPTLHDARPAAAAPTASAAGAADASSRLGRALDGAWQQLRGLVRVSDIDSPEAALLTPEQGLALRANMKQRLLNARMGMLARQPVAVRGDLDGASDLLARYFDPSSRQVQHMLATTRQLRGEVTQWDVPRIDDSLAALAAAGNPK